MSLRGLDVSKWQGTINWSAVKSSCDFVFMKATQGTVEIDSQFIANRNACRSLAIPHGFYHYPNGGNPVAEADYFIKACGRQNGEGQSLDFEGAILSNPDPAGWALAFDNEVYNKTKNRPIDYMSGSVTSQFNWSAVVKANYGLWVADWGVSAPPVGAWPFWALWQTSDNGHVAGISGNVDTDDFNGTLQQLAAYFANVGTSTPTPSPVKPAPVPAPKPAPKPAQPVPGTYTVVSGDTISGIAAKRGTTVAEIERLNPHAGHPAGNFNVIWPGDKLVITGTAPAPAPKPAASVYVVRSGDTMSSIAAAHGESLATLEHKNTAISDYNLIFPGEHINV